MTNKIKMLVLSLTGQCNFSCRYCYASEHDRGMMSFETAAKAIDLAACSGEHFVLQFSGGEPLLNFNCLKKPSNMSAIIICLPACSCRQMHLC